MKLYRLNFTTGYRIGYRRPSTVIDSAYLYRALLKISSIAGLSELAEAILGGKVLLSSILPGAKIKGREMPLIPIPRLPVAVRKFKARYATPEAIQRILENLPTDLAVRGMVGGISLDDLKIKYLREHGVVAASGEMLEEVYIPRIEIEYRNTIDRISSAANPYLLAYTRADRMYLAADAGKHQGELELALKLLGELGLGGIRSRGLGRFTIEPLEQAQLASKIGPITTRRSSILLGPIPMLPQIDSIHTLASILEVTGYSAELVQVHKLPRMILLGPGSIVRLKEKLDLPVKWRLGADQVFIFNPVVLGGV